MCGFSGFFNTNASLIPKDKAISFLIDMNNQIQKRGPDAFGYYFDETYNVGLGHRRLSILELSNAGSQPMTSQSGRYTIVYNGEIYNHLILRQQILDCSWIGHSDTETLLACFERWGVLNTLQKVEGMFAFALYDQVERKILLGRDRIGEKPIYYGWQNETFLFGSELKALQKHPSFLRQIDKISLDLYIKNGYVPAPKSIFLNIFKLKPGSLLTINLEGHHKNELSIVKYWDLLDVIDNSKAKPFLGSPIEANIELEKLIIKSVKQQMLSDVSIGAFLSGGTDSSLVVAIMQSLSNKPINTFTIGFEEKTYNEAHHAKKIANYLGTNHSEQYISNLDAINLIPKISSIYDEPFADASQIPTYLVSKLAKKSVTVSLSGDAGDELFGGYERYSQTVKVWNKLSKVPLFARSFLSTFANRSIAQGLNCCNINEFYDYINQQWKGVDNLILNNNSKIEKHIDITIGNINSIEGFMIKDTLKYLPDDILVKVDRAAMSNSLETRVPLLNSQIIQFAWSLPFFYKCNNGINKIPLKNILYNYVPSELLDRPKMGFGVPFGLWLRGPLRDWAESLLSVERLQKDGIFNVTEVRNIWNEHITEQKDRHYWLWTILMFQSWYDDINI